jgi:hypothetical protein
MQAASGPSASKYQIKKEDIPKIITLLKSIEDDQNADPFLEPVAWQGNKKISMTSL